MSAPLGGVRMPYTEARVLAGRLYRDLVPLAEHVMVVGSLRRKQATVGDLELLVAPCMRTDLFGVPLPDLAPIQKVVRSWGAWGKGGDRYMQVRMIAGPMVGLKVDVFLAYEPASWGSLLAIRTGPAELGKLAMQGLLARGMRHVDGHVMRGDAVVPTPTEDAFFEAAGLPCVPPEARDALVEQLRVNALAPAGG